MKNKVKDLDYINKTLDKVKDELLIDIEAIFTKQKELILNDNKMLDYLHNTQLRCNSGSAEALLEINILTRVMEEFKLNNK